MQLATRKSRTLLVTALAGATLLVALAVWASRGDAFGFVEKSAGLGLVGITEGQTLRLNAVNVAVGNPEIAPACRVSLGFADLEGSGISDPEDFELRPGQGAFVDLSAEQISDPNIRDGGRAQIRAVALGGPDTRTCHVIYSAELFGPGTNQTEVYMQATGTE